jgi:DNA-binding NarL/FixJ family response regulator
MQDSTSARVPRQPGAATDVVVIDDHRTFAELLALALKGEPDLNCAGTAESLREGLAMVDRLRPEVVVMDVNLGDGDGIDATARLVEQYPDLRVVVLTAHADRAAMHRASDAGACALLPKDGSLSDMLSVLRTAHQGGFVVHPRLLKRIVSPARPVSTSYVPPLTRREQEVLQLLADGLDARAVAHRLGITLHTCRGYIKNLLLKLDAHSQLEAVAIATRNGLVRVKSRH